MSASTFKVIIFVIIFRQQLSLSCLGHFLLFPSHAIYHPYFVRFYCEFCENWVWIDSAYALLITLLDLPFSHQRAPLFETSEDVIVVSFKPHLKREVEGHNQSIDVQREIDRGSIERDKRSWVSRYDKQSETFNQNKFLRWRNWSQKRFCGIFDKSWKFDDIIVQEVDNSNMFQVHLLVICNLISKWVDH